MYLVDFPRKTSPSSSIVVPPFHTGPVGLLPDTEVHLSFTVGHAGAEVVVRPYQSNLDNLMYVACTMKDQPGVMGHLVDAISDHDINIVSEVSSVIDHLSYHSAFLLVDWSTSREHSRKTPSTPGERRHYRDFQSLFPITIHRCVCLFESICRHCGNFLVMQHRDGIDLPLLTFRELPTPSHLLPYGAATVKHYGEDQRHAAKPYHVEIELPQPLLTKLRLHLREPEKPLWYILVSEAETRTLRAFFPRPEIMPHIVHLGFFHLNTPGAYAAILHPLGEAGFNIISSLIRQSKDGRNVLEAVLEYRGSSSIPQAGGEELCLWAAKLIIEHARPPDAELFQVCDLQIGLPLYPRRDSHTKVSIPGLMRDSQATIGASLATQMNQIAAQTSGPLITLASGGRKASRPSVYLSYLHEAYLHAAMVRKRLETRYRILDLPAEGSEPLIRQPSRSIEDCDYFIGIWLGEGRQTQVSQQLLELGIAIGMAKRAIILHTEGYDSQMLEHIGPGVLSIGFSHSRFEDETIPLLEKYCLEYFKEDTYPDSVLSRSAELIGKNHKQGIFISSSSVAQLTESAFDRRTEPAQSSKAEFARQYIREHGSEGVTAGDLYDAFVKADISIQREYVYSLLRRMQDQKHITAGDRGRYYPVVERDFGSGI